MLLNELYDDTLNEWGVITKQNTTADVKPGEVQRQAKKLGMTIDKNGHPPLAHKSAAKNTSPNKAYNLGLVNEGKLSRSLVTALAFALAIPGVSTAEDTASDAYDLARQIYKVKDITRAGVEEEATGEIKNILRTIQGHPNQSKILDIFKNTLNDGTQYES